MLMKRIYPDVNYLIPDKKDNAITRFINHIQDLINTKNTNDKNRIEHQDEDQAKVIAYFIAKSLTSYFPDSINIIHNIEIDPIDGKLTINNKSYQWFTTEKLKNIEYYPADHSTLIKITGIKNINQVTEDLKQII